MERIMSRCLLVVVASLFCPATCLAQQDDLPVASVPPVASLTIDEVDAAIVLGADKSSRLLRLVVRVSLTNKGQTSFKVDREQFRLLANGKPTPPAQPDAGETFPKRTVLPTEVSTGLLLFSGIPLTGEEIPFTLQWAENLSALPAVPDTNQQAPKKKTESALSDPSIAPAADPGVLSVNLNQEIRRLNRVEKSRLGPDGELQVLTVHRGLDILAAWTLRDELEALSAARIKRLLFVPAAGQQISVSDEFSIWLTTMLTSGADVAGQVSPIPMPRVTASFKHISLADFKEAIGRPYRNGRRGVQQHRSVDDAVCAALTPLYRFVPVEQAIADLNSPNAGIRRASIAGAVDRLTVEQASAIVNKANSGFESQQLEVASYLSLIPGKAAVEALRDMCLSENSKVASVALRSLARSRDDSAEAAMAEIWKAGETTPSLQSQAVQAIVESPDDRWLPLVADYVSLFLKQATQPDAATIPSDSIPSALMFLHKRRGVSTDSEVRRALLKIRNPSVQDTFLQHLMQAEHPSNEAIIRECVTVRLKDGQVSPVIANAAARYRDSAWTEALMSTFTMARNDNRASPQYFHAALECASHEQLDAMAENLTSFNVNHRAELLQHLARINHPHWRPMAAGLISNPSERCSEVIQLLSQDASEESLLILRTRLEEYVRHLEGTPDASVEGQHFFQTLMVHISMFVHPECRRVMNRMARNPSVYVNERAGRLKADASRRSPAFRSLLTETQQRREGNEEDANRTLAECLDQDPLLPEIYVRRASVAMHSERFEESIVDLKAADRLSPEDIEVQSMIGLVMVRLNDIEKGLNVAEQTILMAPKDQTSLYNGACTFARATESSVPDPDKKKAYSERAIELLRQTAAVDFFDSEHMLKDADLNSLHEHPEWKTIVDLVNANKAPAPDAPQNDQ